jgi:spore coat polysaccharide biosynthesis protein SpsF (cytidylyltransferase family)
MLNNRKVYAIILARAASKRLPDKAMLKIGNRTL